MAGLACVVTIHYRRLAGGIGGVWFGRDELIVARKGSDGAMSYFDVKEGADAGDIVGVAVLAWRQGEGRLGRKGRRVGRGWIRGWTVSFVIFFYPS